MGDAGTGIEAGAGAWTFEDEGVARAFDEHVALSVPEYDDVQALVARLSGFWSVPGSTVVDLGCSTGTTLALMQEAYPGRGATLVGVDESAEMVDVARDKHPGLTFVCDDAESYVSDCMPANTSLVLALYSLQFIAPAARRRLVLLLGERLALGSGLIVVEKTVAPSGRFSHVLDQVYLSRKLDAGFTAEQVMGKAASLRGVLRPVPAETTESWLEEAGFETCRFWQSLGFVGWICERV